LWLADFGRGKGLGLIRMNEIDLHDRNFMWVEILDLQRNLYWNNGFHTMTERSLKLIRPQ
jgi:hypothetical protein